MEMEFIHNGEALVAEITGDGIVIANEQDALELLADSMWQGADKMIINSVNIVPEFFDLRTGIAGAILQKFSNYRFSLAIIGDFKDVENKALRDFIRESNRRGLVIFVASREEALNRFTIV